MSAAQPTPRALSRRENPRRKHPQSERLKDSVASSDTTCLTIYLPRPLHAKIKLHMLLKRRSMRKITTEAIVEWVDRDIDIPDIGKKIQPIPPDVPSTTFVIYIPTQTHSRVKLFAALNHLSIRSVVVHILEAWTEEHCTEDRGADQLANALTGGS